MIALKIINVKQFMGRLLGADDFDGFLLEEASISTYNTFQIDGHQNRAFYTSEEWEDRELRPYAFTQWKVIRPVCFDLIKGRRTPAAFHFVLHLIPEYTASILKRGDTFLMDKTPDVLWDQAVRQFLSKREISFEEL